ncbi:Sulfite exporter TauE/SafE [Paraliobacillus sp. PM-2]|uniref:TSUP family transporter n=1 Tax=Paraliobacillus sp. PM-2 TaxID=1462524 RepID=UPI00061C876C|nr:TSUP family transporter [Paraliobacillus sp. PM-2]CQR47225.1 Sulfite exporter TauE/SafE [Paraliobacillus sp. PM-2]
MFVLYFIIGLFATTLGAIAGLGGGVIIKPLLDFFGHYDLSTIGILSAATVFSMATVSLIKMRKMDVTIDKMNSALIAGGSILGGFIGKAVFNYFVMSLGISKGIGIFQSILLAILLLLIFIYFKYKHVIRRYTVTNRAVILSIGILLGLLSSFLGIGGGPLNVAILSLLFSMDAKNAACNSIFIIFFSQLSALVLAGVTTEIGNYDLSMLPYMIIGGIVGGLIGTHFVHKITNKQVEKIFNIAILAILFINIYNIFAY